MNSIGNHIGLWLSIILLLPLLALAAHALFERVHHTIEWSLLRPLEHIAQRLFAIETELRLANHHRHTLKASIDAVLNYR